MAKKEQDEYGRILLTQTVDLTVISPRSLVSTSEFL